MASPIPHITEPLIDPGTGRVTDAWHRYLEQFSGALSLAKDTLTLTDGVNSDIALPTATFLRIIGLTDAFSTTGFANGFDGRLIVVRNTLAQAWTITNEATSATGNQIITQTGADVVLTGTGGSSAWFVYDVTASRWLLMGTQG